MSADVHYELYVRRRLDAPWTLDLAGEDRAAVLALAEEMFAERRCAGVRVIKEVFDPHTGRFSSVKLMEQGVAPGRRRAAAPPREPSGPLCTGPHDLYTAHARDRIGRLLEGFLQRRKVTPWELLHRPDLAEDLEASGVEVQGAVQRVAVPEAQGRGVSTHEMVRAFQALADAALKRLIRDGRRRAFPEIDTGSFAVACGRLCDASDGAYLLGGGVAEALRQAGGWRAKTEMVTALLAAAPEVGRPRALACRVLEPLLGELLGGAAPLGEVLGVTTDLGAQLGALLRIAAQREVQLLHRADGELLRALPPLDRATTELAELLNASAFDGVRMAICARVLRELNGPRRLRPGDAEGEIAVLRALAGVLTAARGPLVSRDAVHAAFVERSKRLVSSDFVGAYLEGRGGPLAEARALMRLCENLTGPINKTHGARWLAATLDSLRFEKEVRHGADTPGVRLGALAALQRAARAAALPEPEASAVHARLGAAGGWVDDEAKVVATLSRSPAALPVRVAALARLATGETAPLGPASDRARAETLKLLRGPGAREALASAPESLALLQPLTAPVEAAAA